MFDSLLFVAALIVVLWIAALIYYIYTSSRQGDLLEEIDALKAQLDEEEKTAATG